MKCIVRHPNLHVGSTPLFHSSSLEASTLDPSGCKYYCVVHGQILIKLCIYTTERSRSTDTLVYHSESLAVGAVTAVGDGTAGPAEGVILHVSFCALYECRSSVLAKYAGSA